MRRFVLIFFVVFFMLTSVFLANVSNINSLSDLIGKTIGLVGSSVAPKEAIISAITSVIGGKPGELIFFNSNSDGITALMFGKIDSMMLPAMSAEFYIKRNQTLKKIEEKEKNKFYTVMVLRTENSELRDRINNTIKTLEKNGKLKELQDEWINNFPADREPSMKEIPLINGAKTYYVGVSGDMTPLDYIGVDGRPAGFNVALLSEISKQLNINFKFLSLENQAKYTALHSRKIDIIFCTLKTKTNFTNLNQLTTEPYFSFEGVCYLVKK